MAQVEKYPYEIVKDSVFRQMCDTKTSPGNPYRSETAFLERGRGTGGENPLVMVLEDLQDPGNAGTILRTGEGPA